jgi:serine/threonine protein kinase
MDIGETADGLPYIVMEYINGASLDRLLVRAGSLQPLSVARLSIGILQALEEAHAVGVIHRDLKPGNILVVKELGSRHPVARVLDFGIARVEAGAIEGLGADTIGETIFCTPQYAAPEVLRGHADARSDLYALGQMMAEMLAGRPPYYQGSPFEIAAQQLAVIAVPLPAAVVTTPLHDVIRRAVAKPVDQRWDSAAAMLEAVDEVYQQLLRASRTRRRRVKRPTLPAPAPPPPVKDAPPVDDAPQSPRTIGMIARALEIEEIELDDSDVELVAATTPPPPVRTQSDAASDAAVARPAAPAPVEDGASTPVSTTAGATAEDIREGDADNDDVDRRETGSPHTESARQRSARKQVLAPRKPALSPGPGASTVALRRAELSSEYAAVMGNVKARTRRNRFVTALVLVALGLGGTWAALRFGDAWADPDVAVAEASALVGAAAVVPDAHRFTFSANVDGGQLRVADVAIDLPVFNAFGPLDRPLTVEFTHPRHGVVQYTLQSPGPVSYRVAFGQP